MSGVLFFECFTGNHTVPTPLDLGIMVRIPLIGICRSYQASGMSKKENFFFGNQTLKQKPIETDQKKTIRNKVQNASNLHFT